MNTITSAELHHLLAQQPGLPVLDVRTPAEYAAVHVPQARNEPLDRLQSEALAVAGYVAKDQPVYLLCERGGRAAKAAEQLTHAGFTRAVVVEGGTQAWIQAGLPVDRGTVTAISIERQVRIAAGSLVVTGVLLAYVVHPGFIAISAFVGAGLIFAGITDWCGMGLLLARLPWNTR